MAHCISRYILVGIAATLAGVAWGDTMYMLSRQDGGLYFGSAPAALPFGAYSKARRLDRRPSRLPVQPWMMGVADTPAGKSRYELLVDEVARNYELDSALLHAVISVESRYDPNAQSPSGAAGLMQLMPATARRYGVKDVLDPEQNIRGGARYLRDLLGMFGSDIRLALAAYHAGEFAVARHRNRIPPFQSTMDFVSRVLDLYNRYRGSRGN